MSDVKNKITIDQIVSQPYKYGFTTEIEKERIPIGLDENTIRLLSLKKDEPNFMYESRLQAFKIWQKLQEPNWAELNYPKINYQDIIYYSAPKLKKKLNSLSDVDPELLKTFDKLGISLNEQKRLSNVAVDAVFDSVSIATTFKKKI
jgi:Fe-S cluster assembly protein SufB